MVPWLTGKPAALLAAGLAWSLVACSPPGQAPAKQPRTPVTLSWTVNGLTTSAGTVDFESLAHHVLDVEVRGAAIEPRITLQASNPDSGEASAIALTPVANQRVAHGWRLTYDLAQVIPNLPYPVAVGAFNSKVLAIMAQQSQSSPYRLGPAELRSRFADIAQYMLITADHHYSLPLGDGDLVAEFESMGAHSAPIRIRFGRGLPAGDYERDWSRPKLDGWPTFVIGPEVQEGLPSPPAVGSDSDRTELQDLVRMQSRRTAAEVRQVRRWDDGSAVGPWIDVALDAIVTDSLTKHSANPVRISRALALVSVAMYDATVAGARAAWSFRRPAPCALESHLQPLGGGCTAFAYPSEHAAVAAAAGTVLTFLYPAQEQRLAAFVKEATTSRLWAGAARATDIKAGLDLGRKVGEAVVVRARTDGSDAGWRGSRPSGIEFWQPTPPDFTDHPLEPMAGTWRPWNLTSGSALRPPEPPRPGSSRFEIDLREVYQIGRTLTVDQQQIASSWEDKLGTFTPPGHWSQIALNLVRAHALNTSDTARVFAALNTAQADAFIAAWDAKYTYWSVRPVTAIRRELDPNWSPYIITPPFPSYVSGHATTSGAASEVLARYFPAQAPQLRSWASEAALSRLLGGIHFRSDNDVGLAVGAAAAAAALNRWRTLP